MGLLEMMGMEIRHKREAEFTRLVQLPDADKARLSRNSRGACPQLSRAEAWCKAKHAWSEKEEAMFKAFNCAYILRSNADLLLHHVKENGADVNKISPDLMIAPIHTAIQDNDMTMLHVLLDQTHVVVDLPCGMLGLTPLGWAMAAANPNAVKLLLERGADPWIQQWNGCYQWENLAIPYERARDMVPRLATTSKAEYESNMETIKNLVLAVAQKKRDDGAGEGGGVNDVGASSSSGKDKKKKASTTTTTSSSGSPCKKKRKTK